MPKQKRSKLGRMLVLPVEVWDEVDRIGPKLDRDWADTIRVLVKAGIAKYERKKPGPRKKTGKAGKS